jgi:hypothetical protein
MDNSQVSLARRSILRGRGNGRQTPWGDCRRKSMHHGVAVAAKPPHRASASAHCHASRAGKKKKGADPRPAPFKATAIC